MDSRRLSGPERCSKGLHIAVVFVTYMQAPTQPSILSGLVNVYLLPASAGKAKAGMVHSVSGCMRGVQVKLLNPLTTHAIPECLRFAHEEALYKSTFTLPLPL